MNRKQFLTLCVMATAFVGMAFVAFPFVASWNPNPKSQRVLDIDISDLKEGSSKMIEWDHKPVVIYKPSIESSNYLISLNDVANGPDLSAETMPQYFVYVPLSTHYGCMLKNTEIGFSHDFGYIGYWDPCHRGFWDYAGRLIPSVHAGMGLEDLKKIENYKVMPNGVLRFTHESI